MRADALPTPNPRSGLTTENEDTGDTVIAEEIASGEFAIICKLQPSDTVRAYVEAGSRLRQGGLIRLISNISATGAGTSRPLIFS
jgi:hypothetical protein